MGGHPLDRCLKECDSNWKNAEARPGLLQQLIDEEIAQGWVAEVHGGEAAARLRWPKGIAIGKLNVVQAEGKDPRMVLDSSICNVNPLCTLPERVCLPTSADVRASFKPKDPKHASQGAALDFKAAHKRVKVKPSDQGLLLFRHANRLFAYVVCHFGARFSAYWWQRVGALLLRLLHHVLAHEPHKAWLYVDDLLLCLLRHKAPEQLALTVAFLTIIGAPISWKKAAFGDQLIWCGWKFCFATESACLAQPKLDKLRAQLLSLLEHKRVPRKELESCLGLLMWATSVSSHLRCFAAPLYADLHSPPGTQYPIPPRSWSQFLWCLDSQCRVTKDASYLQLPIKAKVIEVKGKPVSSKTDIWPIPAADKTVWVRIADPNAQEITLRNDSKAALHWLAQCFTHEFRMPLAQPPLLPCLSAADAMADGAQVGIGGWLCTSSQTFWFAQQWSIAELRAHWPFLTKDAQQYIACFETIAQWVLLQMAYAATGCSSLRFCLPTLSDNSPTQASVNKLFTTAFPLCLFLQKVASWAHAKGLSLEVGHIPGVKNTDADDLSRNRLQKFASTTKSHRFHVHLHDLARSEHEVSLWPSDANWSTGLVQVSAHTA